MKTQSIIIICVGILALIAGFFFISIDEEVKDNQFNVSYDNIEILPVEHASLVIKWDDDTLAIDPTGDATQYQNTDIVFITDIHGDHLSTSTLQAIDTDAATLVTPDAVMKQLGGSVYFGNIEVMANWDEETVRDYTVTAIPMYNVPESEDAFHPKGRGNGYLIEKDGVRVYIAGDTGNHRFIRGLENIDIAFVPMNLPYTMTVDDAAEAVLAFAPKIVYPYHYRGQDDFGDIERFKSIVNKENSGIEVRFANWYPKRELGTSLIENEDDDTEIREAYRQAAEVGTTASYQAFIKANRDHPLAEEARFELDTLRGIK